MVSIVLHVKGVFFRAIAWCLYHLGDLYGRSLAFLYI